MKHMCKLFSFLVKNMKKYFELLYIKYLNCLNYVAPIVLVHVNFVIKVTRKI